MSRCFSAGTGEKMQYLAHRFNDHTIRFVLRYPGRINAERLGGAVLAVVQGVDVLHASFIPGKLSASWRVNDRVELDECFQWENGCGDPVLRAIAEALKPIQTDGPVQLRCFLAQGRSHSAIAVTMSHLCVDGSDGKYLLCKLAQAYRMIGQCGSTQMLAIKNGSRAAEQIYHGLRRREIHSLCVDPRTGVKSGFPFVDDLPGDRRMLWRNIDRDVMNAARIRARGVGATVNDLLLTAFYEALAQMEGVDPQSSISITSMMDLRRHCPGGDSEGLSNLSGSLMTMLPSGMKDTFENTLREIAAQTRNAKQKPLAGMEGMPLLHGVTRILPMSLLLKAGERLYGSMSLGMTNLGNVDCGELAMDGLVPDQGWFGGPLKQKPGMQLSAASFDGSCTLASVGSYTQADAAKLDQLLDRMADTIQQFT